VGRDGAGSSHCGRLNASFLALMALGAAITVAGLFSAAVPQALAVAAAAAFEPVAKLALGLIRRSGYAIRRALIAVAGGHRVMALAGAPASVRAGRSQPRMRWPSAKASRRTTAHCGRP
jgi:hypothetical protein